MGVGVEVGEAGAEERARFFHSGFASRTSNRTARCGEAVH